jgi:hypothetical protein
MTLSKIDFPAIFRRPRAVPRASTSRCAWTGCGWLGCDRCSAGSLVGGFLAMISLYL